MHLIIGVLTLVMGIILVKLVVLLFKATLKRGKMPPLMADFLGKFVSAILYVVVFLMVLGAIGIQIGSVFIGLSAALGLVLAFGMQDTLNNMFAGIWLATLGPIRMDEVVEVAGMKGKVTGLNIMSTELNTPDNTYITIPNRQVWGSPIKNDTRMPNRRVDIDVGVAYGTDLSKALKIAMALMKKNKMVLKDPAPDVVVMTLADSSINLQLRPWCKTGDYWTLKGALTRKIPRIYEKESIEIPFPQLDVHLQEG
ncbi:MAG: mechanosensitive ion channel family protein [Candidatus Thermoplasmatota archaeon]|nr:mechanosensitive ion channel family protein [Candidatus Thermoplasmatota archaeon]